MSQQDQVDGSVGDVTFSARLSELNLLQLGQLSNMLGREIDKLRTDRAHLAGLMAVRRAAGERESVLLIEQEARAAAEADTASGDAAAPGALIVATAQS